MSTSTKPSAQTIVNETIPSDAAALHPTARPIKPSKPATARAAARKASQPDPSIARRAAVRSAATLLKQVSDPTRLEILLMLTEGPIHVGAICERLGNPSQPAVSHHLALCRSGRLISPRRDGKFNFYELSDEGRRLVDAVRVLVGG